MKESIFYHELGHIVGYILANRKEETSLGEIESFNHNCIIPKNRLYHSSENMSNEDFSRLISTSTKNIPRTIAWFIEVLSGCTFELIFSESQNINSKFETCFAMGGHGEIDAININLVRPHSNFRFKMTEISQIQNEYFTAIKKSNIIDSISEKINFFYQKIQSKDFDFPIKGETLENISNELENSLTTDFINSYEFLIKKYSNHFKKSANQ